jgi:hypothetical protein
MALPTTIPTPAGERRGLRELGERVRPRKLAGSQRVQVLPPLAALLPQGLARGSVVAVESGRGLTGRVAGTTSLALALAAGAAQEGAWVAVVDGGSLGLMAAHGLGVPLERLVVVAEAPPLATSPAATPSPPVADRTSVVAALVDGFDVVLLGPGARSRLRGGDARRLQARVRERGAVLVGVGGDLPGGSAQVRLTVTATAWEGIGEGEAGRAGHLLRRRATVEATGRGAASRPRRAELWLPGPDGTVAAVTADPAVLGDQRRSRRPDAIRDAPADGTVAAVTADPAVLGRPRSHPHAGDAAGDVPAGGAVAAGIAGRGRAARHRGETASTPATPATFDGAARAAG